MTDFLERIPDREEILAAIKCCDSSKSCGCDGFNLNFIKKLWNEIGEEFI